MACNNINLKLLYTLMFVVHAWIVTFHYFTELLSAHGAGHGPIYGPILEGRLARHLEMSLSLGKWAI